MIIFILLVLTMAIIMALLTTAIDKMTHYIWVFIKNTVKRIFKGKE